MMRVLITGVTGNMGSLLAKKLLELNCNLVGLKRSFSDMRNVKDIANNMSWVDIDTEGIEAAFCEIPDCVVHTATCYGRLNETPNEIMEANFLFPFKVLQCAVQNGVKRFFNTDTVFPEYINMYALSKHSFRRAGGYFVDHGGIKFVNLRIGHMYGHKDKTYQFVPFLINACLSNISSINLTEGVQKLDFVHVSDVVEAFVTVMLYNGELLNSYDVGCGSLVTVRELAALVKEITGSNVEFNFGAVPYRKHEIMVSDINIASLEKLGWRPKISLYEGLKATVNSFRRIKL